MNFIKEYVPESPLTFAALKDLTAGAEKGIEDTFKRLGQLLAPSGLRATLQVCLLHGPTGQSPSYFKLVLTAGKATISSTPAKKPDVELIMTPETWLQIAAGKAPPHQAFLSGRMRVRGNTDLAQRMLTYVAAGPGRTHLCMGE